MKTVAIFVCNTINFMSRIFGNKGSNIGGYWALKICPNILKKIKYPKYLIGISGSTGKGSTTNLIAEMLKFNGYSVAYNKEGSNAINGIASLILKNVNLKGVFTKDVLLMELDEKHSVNILKNFNLTHYVLTNITRDQPPRNVHPDYVLNEMKKNIKAGVHVVANADDPIIYKLCLEHTDSTFYGINENNYTIPTHINYIDAAYCPLCEKKLNYEYYLYGHLGNYKCPNNDFNRPSPDVYATNLDIKNSNIKINGKKVKIIDNYLYMVYAYLACYTLGKTIGIKENDILSYFKSLLTNHKPNNIYMFEGRKWHILICKNENQLSYKQAMDYLSHETGTKTIITGFDSCSRRYKENDISWLWDVDYEQLKDDSIDKIVIVGKFKYNILNRLIYAGIDEKKCILIDSYTNDLISTIRNETKGNLYPIVCFDAEQEIKTALKNEGVEI